MIDLFADEQAIYDEAVSYLSELRKGAPLDIDKLDRLAKEYGSMLKQARMTTKISDRVAITLNESKHELLDKVHSDGLTGIHNRRYLDERLDGIVKSLARGNGVLSVMMMDIDYFKKYNDTYGHSQGDECLKSIARAVEKVLLRPDDFVARYGGEEFAVVLPSTDEMGARFIAEKILEAVRELNIPHSKSDVAECVTLSIGVTTGIVLHERTPNEFIKCCDAVLYESKRSGRNRYTYADFTTDLREDL